MTPYDPPELRDPWERQPGEGDERWQAFTTYRDQPLPRSLRRLAADLGKDASLVARWSSADGWQERVAAWDLEQDRQRREAMRAGNIEAGERHATIAAAGLQAASRVNLAWLTRLGANAQALAAMDFVELSELMVKVNRVVPRLVVAERLARGMTTESIEVSGNIDAHREQVEKMTDAELDAFLLGASTAAAVDASASAESDASDG